MKKNTSTAVIRTVVAGLGAFAFLSTLPAHAEIKAGNFELSPFVGYNFFENKQNLEDRPFWGGRLGYNITNRFALEGRAEFMRSRVDDQTLEFTHKGQFTSPIGNVDIDSYHVDLLYHFMPERKFNPFIVAGYGITRYSPKINDKYMSTFNLGAGAKYWMTDNIAFRFDLRDNMVSEVFKHDYHNINVTAGLVFTFGGTTKAKPARVVKSDPKPVEKVLIVVAEESEQEVQAKVLAAEEKIIILAFEDIHFDFDKASLNPEAKRVLKRSIQALKANPNAKIRIAGYTSAAGTKEYNQNLSEERANSVRNYLIEEGVVSPERLTIIGYGQTRPARHEAVPGNVYSAAAKANMRVIFEIIVK